MRSVVYPAAAMLLVVVGSTCKAPAPTIPSETQAISLVQARRGFTTNLTRKERDGEPVPPPPAQLFRTVRFSSPAGQLAGYVSKPPSDGKKHPAIIWIVGGFGNSIGDTAWKPASPDNDQSARAFRQAGVVTMYPSFRGGNDNPGYKEVFYGEVDDVIAAAEYLAHQEYVDPKRIYLGGHSTGGTLALLVAEFTDRFRSVFSFGPVADVRGYGAQDLPFDTNDSQETRLRSPIYWLSAIRTPTFVFEGHLRPSNIASVRKLAEITRNPQIHYFEIGGVDHFGILAALTPTVAHCILHDTNPSVALNFAGDGVVPLR